jgi:hypothetical protein
MPRNAAGIISAATAIAKCPNYTIQALAELNSLLAHIAATVDFSAARGQWFFTFNPSLTTSGGGNIVTTGPNPMPIDYLRVQTSAGATGAQRSSKWYLQGVAYDMVEIDLTELDDQVQQAGLQSYPFFWAKDFAQYQPIIEVTGTLTAGSPNVSGLATIDAGTFITQVLPGMSVAGGIGPQSAITPGATILSTSGGPPILNLVLSEPATASLNNATLLIGNPAVGYAYPPPSGSYNAMIRYQRRMPRMTQQQVSAGAYCWFEDDMALVDGLAGLLCKYTDDTRMPEFIGDGLMSHGGLFGKRMAQYLRLADDTGNRAQQVQLDRRTFGGSYSNLPNTKTIGWLVLLSIALAGMMGLPIC